MWSFFLTAFGAAVTDQLTKLWITANLLEGQVWVQAGIFQIIRIPRNSGAAFGLFQGQSPVLIVIDFIGIALLLAYVLIIRRRYAQLDNRLTRIALGLVLGGTIGNLIDRLRFGAVTDFISVGWWPVFNVADSCIDVGVIIFAIMILSQARKETS
jgi:signal peptidase II